METNEYANNNQSTPTSGSLNSIKTALFSSILIPLLVIILGWFFEYKSGWFIKPADSTFLFYLLSWLISLITGLLIGFFVTALITFIIWLRPYRYVREVFAAVGFITEVQLILFLILSIITGFMPWNIDETLSQGIKPNYSPTIIEDSLLVVGTILITIVILNGYNHWGGLKSVEQRQAESEGKKQGLYSDALLGISRFLKRENFIVSKETKLTDYIPQLTQTSESLSWKEQAKELIRLSSSSYRFMLEDWHDRYGYWIGKNINTEELICLYPARVSITNLEIDNFITYINQISKVQKTKIGEIIIAIQGDVLPTLTNSKYKNIRIDTEANLLNNLIDFRDYINDIRNRVEYNKLMPSNLTFKDVYVPASYTDLSGTESSENVEEYLNRWLSEPGFRQVALLGEYGQGKSTTALMFAYNLLFSNAVNDIRKPILIELRGKSPSTLAPIEILGAWASKYRIDPQALMLLLKAGRLVVIFEGFDEMSLAGDLQMRLDHFRRLWSFLYPGTKILITGRPNYFFNDREMMAALGIEKANNQHPFSEAIRLAPFEINQIRQALRSIDPRICDQICSIAERNPRFKELISRPSILFYLSTIWEREKLSEHVESLNSAHVLELFVRDSYRRQSKKEEDGHRFMGLYQEEREFFMIGVACYMAAKRYQNQITGEELNNLIEKLLQFIPDQISKMASSIDVGTAAPLRLRISNTESGLDLVKIDVRTAGLLVDDPVSPGTFRFGHKSIMEFLFALAIAETLVNKQISYITGIIIATKSNIDNLLYFPVSVDFLSELVPMKTNIIAHKEYVANNQYEFAERLLCQIYEKSGLLKNIRAKLVLFNELSIQYYKYCSILQKLVLVTLSIISDSRILILLLGAIITAISIFIFDHQEHGYYLTDLKFATTIFISFFILTLFSTALSTYLAREVRNSDNDDHRMISKFYKNRSAIWLKICRSAGISDNMIHQIAGTSLIPWIRNKPIEFS